MTWSYLSLKYKEKRYAVFFLFYFKNLTANATVKVYLKLNLASLINQSLAARYFERITEVITSNDPSRLKLQFVLKSRQAEWTSWEQSSERAPESGLQTQHVWRWCNAPRSHLCHLWLWCGHWNAVNDRNPSLCVAALIFHWVNIGHLRLCLVGNFKLNWLSVPH